MKLPRSQAGFTLIELMISVTILAILIVTSSAVYVNFFGSVRNVRAANLVYEEARFVMERIVKEIRNGTVDYEEYFNQTTNYFGFGANIMYGQNYCQYSRQFYQAGTDGVFGTLDDESTGELSLTSPSALSSPLQEELYLININGTERTYLKRLERERNGATVGTVGLLKLQAGDFGIDHVNADDPDSVCEEDEGEKDGRIDTWSCAAGFPCAERRTDCGFLNDVTETSFIDITPPSLDIVDVRFIITPSNDPRKAYNTPSVQLQPHVTVRLIARANASLTSEFKLDHTPSITLESTISARVYNEIVTECNLRECLAGQPRSCSKASGVCGPDDTGYLGDSETLAQVCDQGVWPGCTTANYAEFADTHYGRDRRAPFDPAEGRTYYEENSETGSCGEGDTACQQLRCSDSKDNDCNGAKDIEDPSCLLFLCNNGTLDAGERCADVGGFCDFIRPVVAENTETRLCFDNYDNDCSGRADEFDANCVNLLCNNNQLDPPLGEAGARREPFFASPDFEPKNILTGDGSQEPLSLLNEGVNQATSERGNCPDVGGLCSSIRPVAPETGIACTDGLDNDCDGRADELDSNCVEEMCGNGRRDCGLVPSTAYEPPNLLTGYTQAACSLLTLDERCADVGGLCGNLESGEGAALCADNLDNDCDLSTDQADRDCCPDRDGDLFAPFLGAAICSPPGARVAPPFGRVDCDDSDVRIFPGAEEFCEDSARYPAGHPLAGDPVDQNCSEANALTPTTQDRDDPRCCIDEDNDGYGRLDRSGTPTDRGDTYIYRERGNSSSPCRLSAANHELGTETPDCNDDPSRGGAAVNPGVREAGALCSDRLDNDCDGLFDHIDAFPDDFDPDCCDLAAMEICNNGSDDNCSGLRDMDDTFCMEADGRSFFDNFSSTDYRSAGETTALWNGETGSVTLDPASAVPQTATSSRLPVSRVVPCPTNVQTVQVIPLADLPGTSDIVYQFSIDGGTTWCGDLDCAGDLMTGADIRSGANTVNFDTPGQTGTNLRWRATLFGNETDVPVLNSLTLNFTCN